MHCFLIRIWYNNLQIKIVLTTNTNLSVSSKYMAFEFMKHFYSTGEVSGVADQLC